MNTSGHNWRAVAELGAIKEQQLKHMERAKLLVYIYEIVV